MRVLVRFRGDYERLRALGLSIGSIAGDIATAEVALDDLLRITEAPEVIYIEGTHALWPDDGSYEELPTDGG